MRLQSRTRRSLWAGPGAGRRLLRFALLAGCGLALFALGAYLRGTGWLLDTRNALLDGLRGAPNLLTALRTTAPRVTIDIKHQDLQRLADKRARSLASGHLFARDGDLVPASVHLRDGDDEQGPIPVKLRLKGDIVDAAVGSKWPLRLRVRGDRALRGMKRFSLHDPSARNFLGEWVYHRALRREGVIALRYEFVGVTINGRDMGVYALEEHFDRRLVEHNERREGPIVRFNEDTFWQEHVHRRLPRELAQSSGSYSSAEVDGFQTSSALAEPQLRARFLQAAGLLERFRSGELATSEVFDLATLARYFAVSELLGAEHGARWHNARFYFDPILGRLQPIGFDGNAGQPSAGLCAMLEGCYVGWGEAPQNRYYARLFSDPAFLRVYVAELERVSDPAYLRELMAALASDLATSADILHREFPAYDFDPGTLAANAEVIRSLLDPVRGMHAYARVVGDRVELDAGAIQGLPIELRAVHFGGIEVALDEPLLLPGRLDDRPVNYRRCTIELPAGIAGTADPLSTMQCRHAVLGRRHEHREPVLPWPRVPPWSLDASAMPTPGALAERSFLAVDERSGRVHVRPGHHVVDRDLIVPAGHALVIGEGTTIDLVGSAVILSHSPVEFTGTRDNPVRIVSSDGTGQGVVVLDAGGRSTVRGVHFVGLGAVDRPGWQLTGAVTFCQSPVDVHSCRFEHNRSEDALNCVRSPFRLEHSRFERTSSDALDSDFCGDSRIADCTFVDCGNDGIDLSGSQVEIERVAVIRPGDKAVSVGENSNATVRGLRVEDAWIAVASKDLSRIELFEPSLADCKIDFCAYQKKPEFGPSTLIVHGEDLDRADLAYWLEKGSTMMRGSRRIEPTHERLYDFLYGAKGGGGSK